MKLISFLVILSLSATSLYTQSKSVELTHYLLPEFTSGSVIMKDGSVNFALLNYNLLSEEMLFNQRGKILALGADMIRSIDTVTIGGRKFVVENGKFFELLYSGKDELMAEYRCSLIAPGTPAAYGTTTETASAKAYSSLYAGGMVYELTLPDGYKTRPYINYWIKREGKLSKFINIKQLTALYKPSSAKIKEYAKTNTIDFKSPDSIVQILEFLEK